MKLECKTEKGLLVQKSSILNLTNIAKDIPKYILEMHKFYLSESIEEKRKGLDNNKEYILFVDDYIINYINGINLFLDVNDLMNMDIYKLYEYGQEKFAEYLKIFSGHIKERSHAFLLNMHVENILEIYKARLAKYSEFTEDVSHECMMDCEKISNDLTIYTGVIPDRIYLKYDCSTDLLKEKSKFITEIITHYAQEYIENLPQIDLSKLSSGINLYFAEPQKVSENVLEFKLPIENLILTNEELQRRRG